MWLRNFIKEWGVTLAILGFLYFTGLLSDVAAYAQRAVLFTGIMNADNKIEENIEDQLVFDYSQEIKTADGELINMEQFKGKVIFLNLWASWCAPCKAEMPGINQLYEDLRENENIAFVMLSIDRNENAAIEYLKKKDYSFEYYLSTGKLNPQLAVPSIPTTFVISKQGRIIKKNTGIANYNTKTFRNFLINQSEK